MPRIKKHYNDKTLTAMVAVVARNLTHHREQAGLSQTKLAKMSGVALSTINEIENTVAKDLRLSTVTALSRALKIGPNELIGMSDVDLGDDDKAEFQKALKMLERINRRLR